MPITPRLRTPLSLLLTVALVGLAGCDTAPDPEVNADILAKANEPAGQDQSLSADELAIEPEDTVEPLTDSEAADEAFRELSWDDLLPADFDFQTLREKIDLESYDISSMTDDDPEAQRLYSDLESVMADVPFVDSLNGLDAKLPGFLVPLEMEADAVKEFFLVPYFGACIHTPPPPANQIVHVVLKEAVPFDNLYEPYWASGTLTVTRTETNLGTAGYRLTMGDIQPYE